MHTCLTFAFPAFHELAIFEPLERQGLAEEGPASCFKFWCVDAGDRTIILYLFGGIGLESGMVGGHIDDDPQGMC